MCAPALTLALAVAAILSCEGSPHAHHGIIRWAPIPHQLPIDAMIEVVDRLTVDVMQDYAFSRGNFAFSPYGATSVLMALYEGSRGESARQIHAAMKLPWNHDAVRIGFRDLHRKLRVYFVHEGFLNGLTFNKNKTEFRPEYIRALRFYGYEVESVTPASLPSTTESSPTSASSSDPSKASTESETLSTTSSSSSESGTTSNEVVATQELPKSTATPESTTINPPGNETLETTDAVTEKSMEVTTNLSYEPTTKYTSTEISDLTSQPSQTTTKGMTTVPENVQTTTEGVTSPETQRPSTATTTFTTNKEESSAGETTENVQNTVTPTPSDNSQVTSVPSGLNEKTTEIGTAETTNSKTTSEQTTVIGVLSSTETLDSSTVNEIGSTNEPTSVSPVSEVVTTEIPETLETTTEKYLSTPEEEATTVQPTGSTTPLVQLTTDESTPESSVSSASTMLPTVNTITTEIPTTSDNTSPKSANSADIETTTTVTTVMISSTELPTESPTTTSQTTEETDTPVSVANLDETTTFSEQTSTSVLTSTPRTGARSARNIFSPDSATWLSDFISFIRGVSPGDTSRIVKRSIIEDGKTADRRRQGDFSLQLENGMLDSSRGRGLQKEAPQARLPFLVDGVLEEKVAVSTYTAVLPFAFVPRLDALALELPLENEWHRLVILLPLERRGLQELIYELGSVPLSHVLRSLHRTRVNAIIPNIVVEGFVVLTPTLQKLGIWDVFDPKRADLSGMSRDPELYVRDLEQTLTVDISSKSRIQELPARAKSGRQRIEQFAALHPFLYFVVDRDTKVPLVAGKMVDPLNSRIH